MSGGERGASVSRTQLADRYRGWVRHHRLSAADSLFRVLDKPLGSVLTWLVIGIALALPVGLSVSLDNVGQLSDRWDSGAQISLFLKTEFSSADAADLSQRIGERGDVATVLFVSREEALAEFASLSAWRGVGEPR